MGGGSQSWRGEQHLLTADVRTLFDEIHATENQTLSQPAKVIFSTFPPPPPRSKEAEAQKACFFKDMHRCYPFFFFVDISTLKRGGNHNHTTHNTDTQANAEKSDAEQDQTMHRWPQVYTSTDGYKDTHTDRHNWSINQP